MNKFHKLIKIVFLSLLLTGCGFHLRGHEPLPPQLHILYLQSDHPYTPLIQKIKHALKSTGIILVPTPQQAPVTLQILCSDFTQVIASVGTSGQLTTYILTQTITYQLTDCRCRIIQAPQTASTTRTYSIAANQILGDTAALNSLRNEMQRDAIYQILNHLRSPCTCAALQQVCG